jgi:chemotaxis receptor (MCP) glutamine deamidase CheD
MENSSSYGNAVSSMTAVNYSEMKISSTPVETLKAFSIGSGNGMTIHDPIGGVGGILNFILPDSTRQWQQSRKSPLMCLPIRG